MLDLQLGYEYAFGLPKKTQKVAACLEKLCLRRIYTFCFP